MAPFLVMVLNSTGVHNDVRHGSVGAMLWMALILLLRALQRGRPVAAGLWLAVATLLKLVPILLLPWLAWRAGRRAVLATLVALSVSMIPAFLLWGPSIVVWYLRDALWPAAHLEIAWSNNVSIDALWLRLLAPLTPLTASGSWAPVTSLAARLAGRGTDLLLVGVSVVALWRHRRHRRDGDVALELALLVLLLLLVMRLTWVHTLTSMLFVYPILMFWGAEQASGDHRRRGVTAMLLTSVGFFLSAAHLPVLWGDRWMTWPWLLAPGLHTIGLLCLWALCVVLLRNAAQPPGKSVGRVP